jgi:hypothetical protein
MNKTQLLVPGPGKYDPLPATLMNKTTSPKYGFGSSGRRVNTCFEKARRNEEQTNMTFRTSSALAVPGPGNYQIESRIGSEGQKKTMGGRFKIDLVQKEELLKPGPGQYVPRMD